MGGKIFKVIFIILALSFTYQVLGYNNLITHPLLSGSAADLYNQQASQKLTDLEKSWIIKGSIDEDNDPRYLNHFYNPVTGEGLDGWDQAVGLTFRVQGQSAKFWAKNQNSRTGDYSESAILKNYQEGNLTRAYQGIGHIIHLIQDMAVPAHTRNDPHGGGDPYEKWVEQHTIINPSKLSFLNIKNLDQAFDLMANYSNNNFFSRDSIIIRSLQNYKTTSEYVDGKNRMYLLSKLDNSIFKLAYTKNPDSINSVFQVDDDLKLNMDYWNMLYPKAVGYSAGVIDYFVKQFEQIDKLKKEQEQISWWQKLKKDFVSLKSEAGYVWGDVYMAQRNTLADRYDSLVALITNSQDNFKNFSEANKEIIEKVANEAVNQAKQAGRVLSAFESADDAEEVYKPQAVSEKNVVATNQSPSSLSPSAEAGRSERQAPAVQNSLNFPLEGEESLTEKNSPKPVIEAEQPSAEGGKEIPLTLPHQVRDRLFAKGGNTAPNFIFTAGDRTPPETSLTSAPEQIINLDSASFVFTSSEANSTFQCDLNGGGWQECGSPREFRNLADRDHIFKVRARDGSNNFDQTPAEYSWTVDTTAPEIMITNQPAGFASSTAAGFIFNSSESNSNFTCDLDADGWPTCVSPKSYENLTPGEHSFKVKARDGAGNLSLTPAEFSWVIDLSEPQLTVISGPPDISSSTAANFQFASGEDDIIYRCRLDGDPWQLCSASTTASDLIEGRHNFEMKAADRAGNIGSSTAASWLVDLTAPTSTVASLAEVYEATGFTVSWSAEDAASTTAAVSGLADFDLQYKIAAGDWQDWINATTSTSTVFNLAIDSGQMVYFHSRARDLAGNLGAWSAEKITSISDHLADHIVISEIQVSGASANDEFIELYNPTESNIDLSSFSIQYRGSNSLNFYKKNFLSDSVIRSKAYYLIATNQFSGSAYVDMAQGTFNLSGDGGTVFLVNNAVELTDNLATSTAVIDRLAYGSGAYLFPEGSAYAAVPAAGQSLERKANATSTAETMAAGGVHEKSGNAYDSNNNSSDFAGQAASNPQNSYSLVEPRVSYGQDAILYQENFSNGRADGWLEQVDAGAGWLVEAEKYHLNIPLAGAGAESIYQNGFSWQNYTFSFDADLNDGVDRDVIFRRQNNQNYYSLGLRGFWRHAPDDTPVIYLQRCYAGQCVGNNYRSYFAAYHFIDPADLNNETSHFEIEAVGNSVKVYYNSNLVIDWLEPNDNYPKSGTIGFHGWSGDYGVADVAWDNLTVRTD